MKVLWYKSPMAPGMGRREEGEGEEWLTKGAEPGIWRCDFFCHFFSGLLLPIPVFHSDQFSIKSLDRQVVMSPENQYLPEKASRVLLQGDSHSSLVQVYCCHTPRTLATPTAQDRLLATADTTKHWQMPEWLSGSTECVLNVLCVEQQELPLQ